MFHVEISITHVPYVEISITFVIHVVISITRVPCGDANHTCVPSGDINHKRVPYGDINHTCSPCGHSITFEFHVETSITDVPYVDISYMYIPYVEASTQMTLLCIYTPKRHCFTRSVLHTHTTNMHQPKGDLCGNLSMHHPKMAKSTTVIMYGDYVYYVSRNTVV